MQDNSGNSDQSYMYERYRIGHCLKTLEQETLTIWIVRELLLPPL